MSGFGIDGRPAAKQSSDNPERIAMIVRGLSKLHRWVYDIIRQSPGHTAMELAKLHSPDDSRKIGRRLAELEALGVVKRGRKRTCSVTDREADVWEIV